MWSCYSCSSSRCLLSYYPPTPPLKHSSPDNTHTHTHTHTTLPVSSQLRCAEVAPSGNSYELKWHKYICQSSVCSWARKAKLRVQRSHLTALPASLLSLPHQIILSREETLRFCPKVLVNISSTTGKHQGSCRMALGPCHPVVAHTPGLKFFGFFTSNSVYLPPPHCCL